MKTFELIVVDQDGVLSNFRKGVSNLFNVDLDSLDVWDIPKFIGVKEKDFWKRIAKEESFWLELEKFSYAGDLMNMLKKYSSNIIICSCPSSNFHAYAMKKKWLDDNGFGCYNHFIGNANKGLLAKDNRLLIDDYIGNVSPFREKGGLGIIFPQSYNLEYAGLREVPQDKVKYVERKIHER